MVDPLPPDQSDKLTEPCREIWARLDQIDDHIQTIDARLDGLDCASDRDIAEAERLSAERHELGREALDLMLDLDEIEDPEEEDEDDPDGPAAGEEP